jgi:hypothetical protein
VCRFWWNEFGGNRWEELAGIGGGREEDGDSVDVTPHGLMEPEFLCLAVQEPEFICLVVQELECTYLVVQEPEFILSAVQ